MNALPDRTARRHGLLALSLLFLLGAASCYVLDWSDGASEALGDDDGGATETGEWTEMDSGVPVSLYSVWGASATDVYAAGAGSAGGSEMQGAIVHYDGSTWTTQWSSATDGIVSLKGIGAPSVFAYGFDGQDYGDFVLHYDGVSWEKIAANIFDPYEYSYGIALGATEDGGMFALGAGAVLDYNGNSWTNIFDGDDSFELECLWGPARDDFLVGGWDASGSEQGVILHYDGSTFDWLVSLPGLTVGSMWGASDNEIYALAFDPNFEDMAEHVLHYDGGDWSEVYTDHDNFGSEGGIWGSPGGNVYFVYGLPWLLRAAGGDWTKVNLPTGSGLFDRAPLAIWGASEDDVFVVGADGLILHYRN